MAWHPHHESLLLSGGYNGSLIYWLAKYNQAPHTVIADAHRQSVDVIAWHPAGHSVATASHEGILKFWCREPPGSRLEYEVKEFQDNPIFGYGPLPIGAPNIVQQVAITMPGATPGGAAGGPGFAGGPGSGAFGGRGGRGGRGYRGDGDSGMGGFGRGRGGRGPRSSYGGGGESFPDSQNSQYDPTRKRTRFE
jgi:polyadenylation factor subunit 2